MSYILQLVFNGLTMGSIYALVALGYNIIFSTTNIINFAQGELVMLGAMVALALLTGLKLSLPLAILLGAVVVAGIGIVLERVAYRPLPKHTHGIEWIISTLASGIILQNLAMLLWGKENHPFPTLIATSNIGLGNMVLDSVQLSILGAAFLIAVVAEIFFSYTYIGKALKATSHNRDAAELMGINTKLMVVLCFSISAGLSAIAGMLVSPLTFASANMGLLIGLKGFAAAIIGGMGSSRGAVIGGLLLGVMEIFGAALLSAGFRDIIAFTFLILVLLLKPEGIFGKLVMEKV